MIILKIIFGILCGILYVIGLCLGYNYYEISVYICIYAVPIICWISACFLYLSWFKGTKKHKSFIYKLLIIPISIYVHHFSILARACINHYETLDNCLPYKQNIMEMFNQCYNELMQIACACNTTYEFVNLYIYCGVFFGILIFNCLLYKLIKL